LIEVKSIKVEQPDWHTFSPKGEKQPENDGFNAIFNVVRQDLSQTGKVELSKRNNDHQKPIESIKPDRHTKRDDHIKEQDNETQVQSPPVNESEVEIEAEDLLPVSNDETVEDETPVTDEATPVQDESTPEPTEEPQEIEASETVVIQVIQPEPVSGEAQMLQMLAGQTNAKTTQQQIAKLNDTTQPVLVQPESAPQTQTPEKPPVNLTNEPEKIMECTGPETKPDSAQNTKIATSAPQNEQTVLPDVEVPKTKEPIPVITDAAVEEKSQVRNEPAAVRIVTPEKNSQDTISSFNKENNDKQQTAYSDNQSHPENKLLDKKLVKENVEVSQPVIQPNINRQAEPEKKVQVQFETLAVDTVKHSLAEKTNEAPKLTVINPAPNSTPTEMKENIDQIIKSVHVTQSQNGSRVQLRLDPPELGTLRIEMKQTENGLHLQLQATTPKAQQLLQQHSNELRSTLESQGFHNTRIEVQLRMDLRNDSSSQEFQDLDQGQGQDQMMNQQEGHSSSPWEGENENRDWQPDTTGPAEEVSGTTEEEERENSLGQTNQWQELAFASLDVKA
jgi:flagellar hook-length control protein FliK